MILPHIRIIGLWRGARLKKHISGWLVCAASMKTMAHYFSLNIVSDAFKSKMQPARHRMVYALLKEELDRPGGIHALQLRTKTPEEEAKQASRAAS
jgi:stress-induced morphogen